MSDDPLDGADVGETCHVTHTEREALINVEPEVFWGSDRNGDIERVDAELVETEDGSRFIEYTYEGDVTKTLPRNWDKTREPVTPEQERTARRNKWVRRAWQAVGALVPVTIAVFVANMVMQDLGGLTVNSEPITPPPTTHIVAIVAIVGLLVVIGWIMVWAVQGGLPPMRRYHQ